MYMYACMYFSDCDLSSSYPWKLSLESTLDKNGIASKKLFAQNRLENNFGINILGIKFHFSTWNNVIIEEPRISLNSTYQGY